MKSNLFLPLFLPAHVSLITHVGPIEGAGQWGVGGIRSSNRRRLINEHLPRPAPRVTTCAALVARTIQLNASPPEYHYHPYSFSN